MSCPTCHGHSAGLQWLSPELCSTTEQSPWEYVGRVGRQLVSALLFDYYGINEPVPGREHHAVGSGDVCPGTGWGSQRMVRCLAFLSFGPSVSGVRGGSHSSLLSATGPPSLSRFSGLWRRLVMDLE